MIQDTISKVLYIDLSQKSYEVKDRSDIISQYIGGTGLAIQLLLEECPVGADPLGPENPIILATGPLTGVFPFASKTVAMFKSPHTGDLGESHAGGRSAVALRMAGYGAIVIKGKSNFPIYISISGGKVEFKDATTLWGMKSSFVVGDVIREKENHPGLRTIMRIGKAGEQMVSYAAVVTETYRHFGRLGLGAVFGSKMLKAIAISGKESIPVIDKKAYLKLYKEIYDKAVSSTIMKKYHDLGTSGNVLPLNTLEALPTKNLQTSSFAEASSISGENIAKNYLGRRVACAHCPTGCIHLAALREPYLEEHYFYKTSMIAYDYELLYALGSMLGIKSAEECLTLIDTVEVFCIDAMTTGVVLAWATEMFEKKNISLKETDGIKPQWGNAAMYRKMVKRIITQPTEFYKAIAKGVDFASSKYGGKDFSMAFGKNEMAGYHTGPAAYLGFLIGARHSHLDNAGYSLDQSIMINEDPTPEKIVDKLIEEETLRQVLSSLTMCFFARGIYDIETISKALKVIGISHSAKELLQIGAKIYQQKFKFKFREGFSFDKLHVPERIFETKDPTGKLTKEFIRKGLEYANKKIL